MLEISRMLTISICHITKETAERLTFGEPYNRDLPPYFPKAEYGWFIFTGSEYEFPEAPADLKSCMNKAWEQKCDWLCLDCDGLEVDDLPTYDW